MIEFTPDQQRINNWLHKNSEFDSIRTELQSEQFSDSDIEIYLKEYKKQYYAIRQQRGFISMVAGAFIGFISCLLSVANPFPDLYEVILYGLTSVSILVIFIGLYYFFE